MNEKALTLRPKTDIVAVASSGGHWQQLLLATQTLRLTRSVLYVTTKPELLAQAGIENGRTVLDCNRDTLGKMVKSIFQCLSIILVHRPAVVISTGAAPGIICLAAGRLIGAHTIWIDSFANVEKLSMSGKIARYVANTWLTQWEHLSTARGPTYAGELL
ncbi:MULTISPECIES: glucuronosyltransferase [unclassified Rhizobium]|uniref:glucuronosyltransferase n=1 Tax=unclassified Rhizobium TaxID=2613769 RepID=UPI00191120F6|nr:MULTISPECIES: glucuronosyltransferase [unclassified Rhizobium]